MGSQPIIQTSFNSGEWAPALNARVDLTKYHSGAALLRNFFVDYRGGATTRPGTKYILRCFNSSSQVRLIPFQASFSVTYVLEFGNGYIRFFNNGAPVLETAKAITAITQANPGVITSAGHGFNNSDWVYIASVGGMTQINGGYYIVTAKTANTFQIQDTNGNLINTSAYTAYTSGGTVARVYTLTSPYTSADLTQIKFAQNVTDLILCQPNYVPYKLTLITAANWTITAITFGSTANPPTGQVVATTLGAGTWNYAYVITTVDANGQESAVSPYAVLANVLDLRNNPGTNTVTWDAISGAASYNIYKAELRLTNPVPAGSQFGFVGNVTSPIFYDSNISPDFSQGPPIVQNPFSGTGVQQVTITSGGAYVGLIVPTVSFTGGGGSGAAAIPVIQATSAAINVGGLGFAVFDTITTLYGVVLQVTSTDAVGTITGISLINRGSVSSGLIVANPYGILSTSGVGAGANFNLTFAVVSVGITSPGTGYSPAPTVVFSTGAATATAVLGSPSSGNPTVPSLFQQRMVMAGPVANAQQFNMSQPGAYYNYNVSFPVQATDAIQSSLVSGRLNTIKSLVSMPTGLLILSDQQAWLVNGGSAGSGVSPLNIVANAQAYNGASDLPPIVSNYDILYVQAKGSIVRDLAYNFYTSVYTGANISTLSSHLFFGYTLLEWCWAEEPFKIVWAVRNDGVLLSLTFQKDQEMIAWAHHDTAGSFKSIATVTETLANGSVDAVYVVAQRTINGTTAQYIERLTELYFPLGFKNSWFIDAGVNYTGSAATTFFGAQHLAGLTVTGVADGIVIPAFVMPTNGQFTLATAASNVTVGIPITGQIQTLGLDLGEPTVQGKRKKITGVTLRCQNALGLTIGRGFDSQVSMKDLVLGNVGSMTNERVTDLVTGDARTIIDPLWDVPGQYCIQQTTPYPASVLGVIPEITVGDTK
jgi:hypothetical protein